MRHGRRTWGLFFTFSLLGFLLVAQLRAQDGVSLGLEQQSLDELTTLVGTLSRETERLRREQADLIVRLNDYRYQEESVRSSMSDREKTLRELVLVTGVVAGVGRGIEVRAEDGGGELEAYDLALLVNELRSAGSEAIAVNGIRVDFRSGFRDVGESVALSGRVLETPYVLTGVGEPEELRSALEMAGGVVATWAGRPGVSVSVEEVEVLPMPAVVEVPVFARAVAVEEQP